MRLGRSVFRARALCRSPKLTLRQALEVVDDDAPDGSWWAQLEELTGLDAGDIAEQLEAITREDEARERTSKTTAPTRRATR